MYLIPSKSVSAVRSRIRRRRGRAGFALFETMIGIPLALIGFFVLLTIGMIGTVHTQVAVDARTKAWGGRHEPWKPSELYSLHALSIGTPAEFGRILGPRPRVGLDMAIVALGERPIPLLAPGPFAKQKQAGYWHVVFGGTWDHREVPFEPRSAHPRLTPTHRIHYFGGGIENAMARLGRHSFALGAP